MAEPIGTLAAVLSAIAALGSVVAAWKVWAGQKLLSQRQFILHIWEKISNMNDIDPSNPLEVDVIKAVNVLEFVALCCEGGMVDEQVVKRTFYEGYIKFFTAIEGCGMLPGVKKTGKQLLQENRAAMTLGQSLIAEHVSKGRLEK